MWRKNVYIFLSHFNNIIFEKITFSFLYNHKLLLKCEYKRVLWNIFYIIVKYIERHNFRILSSSTISSIQDVKCSWFILLSNFCFFSKNWSHLLPNSRRIRHLWNKDFIRKRHEIRRVDSTEGRGKQMSPTLFFIISFRSRCLFSHGIQSSLEIKWGERFMN